MLSEREKLEEELRFLEESFKIGVITKEEYESGKQRIESDFKRLDEEIPEREIHVNEIKDEQEVKKEEAEKDVQTKEIKDESQLKLGEEKPVEEKEEPIREEKPVEKEEIEEFVPVKEIKVKRGVQKEAPEEEIKKEEPEIDEEEKKEVEDEQEPETEKVEEELDILKGDEFKINKKVMISAVVLLIVVVGLWYFFSPDKSDISGSVDETFGSIVEEASLIACHSDDDCGTEGKKIGVCSNPGQEDAECTYVDDVEVKLTVLNSQNCFNCQTNRVVSILKNLYPNLDTEEIDFETNEGQAIVNGFNVSVLPAYILNSTLTEAYNYEKFSNAFNEIYGNFVMKNTVANANFYFEREEIPNKLDLFLQQDQEASLKAEENLEEFLKVFGGKVNLDKHSANASIVKDLGINTFPAFLINNRIKFSGVQSADKIRENFCQLNRVTECALGLSKSLI